MVVEKRMSDTSASDAAELRAETLDLLEFPEIRRQVAGHTKYPAARELALSLSPSYVSHEVERLQRETAEGVAHLEQVGDVDLHAAEDVTDAVARASLDGALTGLQLLSVSVSLDVQRRARSALLGAIKHAPMLTAIAGEIPDLQDIQHQISSTIGTRGEVMDSATPTLGGLRVEVRRAYTRVTQALEGIIHSSTGSDAIQDQVISMRGDRLVVQVKTEMRHRVPGIVHDASNTGATLFIEPFASVDLCNQWRELALEEERETQKVLRDLSALVGSASDEINLGTELTARLDFILARARYGKAIGCAAPRTGAVLADGGRGQDRGAADLVGARHPLLGSESVPVTVRVGPGWSVLVITGPNTGGKTVAMKTVGLLALMHQSGLQIPAESGSTLPIFDGVYADVGDQQSIQRSVSTFSSHMRNVIDILAQASTRSLVLLDELGTSTDPEEGSALAKAILGRLASEGVTAIATTHHRTVAAYAEATEGMMNASVELDTNTLMPTYHLTIGVPGRSYAMSVAERMGMPDEIIGEARALLEPQHLRFEDWLNELQRDREQLKASLEEAEVSRRKADETSRQIEAERQELELHRNDILEGLRAEMAQRFDEVDKKIRRAEAALSWGSVVKGVSEARAEAAEARLEFQEVDEPTPAPPAKLDEGPLGTGDLVDIRGLNVKGSVVSIPDHGNEIEVAIGGVHFRIDSHRVSRAAAQSEPESPERGVSYELGPLVSTMELDLRGSYAEDALIKVEEFLDKAMRDGLSSVRIIHGKGTGALRAAVRGLLEHHPLAKSFGAEPPQRGGDGATFVELV